MPSGPCCWRAHQLLEFSPRDQYERLAAGISTVLIERCCIIGEFALQQQTPPPRCEAASQICDPTLIDKSFDCRLRQQQQQQQLPARLRSVRPFFGPGDVHVYSGAAEADFAATATDQRRLAVIEISAGA